MPDGSSNGKVSRFDASRLLYALAICAPVRAVDQRRNSLSRPL